jgi:hypothetical protein
MSKFSSKRGRRARAQVSTEVLIQHWLKESAEDWVDHFFETDGVSTIRLEGRLSISRDWWPTDFSFGGEFG